MKSDTREPESRFHSSNGSDDGIFREASPSPLEEKAKQLEHLLVSAIIQWPETLRQLPSTFGHQQFVDRDAQELMYRLLKDEGEYGDLCPGTVLIELSAGTQREKELAAYGAECRAGRYQVPNSASALRWAKIILDAWHVRQTREAHAQLIRATDNAASIEDVYQAEDAFRDAREKIEKQYDRKGRFEFMTFEELVSGDFTIEYMIDDVLVAHQPCIVAGPEKSLKTNILMDLGISLATATPFLGKFHVPEPKRVLFMSGESGLATLKDTAIRQAAAKGWHDEVPACFSNKLPDAIDLSDLRELEREIVRLKADTLVIDPAYLCLPSEESGNMFKRADGLKLLSRPCNDHGVTMILAHHTKSMAPNPYRPAKLSDIAWAGFKEWARQWLLLSRRGPYEEGSGSHALYMSIGGSAGHGGLWAVDVEEGTRSALEGREWDVTVRLAKKAREDAQQQREKLKADERQRVADERKRKVLKVMVRWPNGETQRQIREAVGINNEATGEAITTLIVEGRVEPCELKKKTGTYPGYRLTAIGRRDAGVKNS